jgi:hypothetical protein
MKCSNYLIWFRRLVLLGAVVAGLTASAAGAVPMLDPQDTPANPVVSHTTPQGLRADGLRWQAIAKAYQDGGQASVPDVFERYAASHPYGQAAFAREIGTERIVDDSFRDPTPIVTPAGDRIVDDYFRDAPAAAPTSGGNGLDWSDFGIGAGAMLGLALLVSGLGLGTGAMRHRADTLKTS